MDLGTIYVVLSVISSELKTYQVLNHNTTQFHASVMSPVPTFWGLNCSNNERNKSNLGEFVQ